MAFSIHPGAWKSVFAVPSTLVDSHIKMASPNQLKVLLWALRHSEESFTHEVIAAALGITTPDVQDAMQYWVQVGLVTETGSEQTVQPAAAAESVPHQKLPLAAAPIAESLPPAPPRRIPKPDGLFIAERINQSAEIRFLMQEAQQLLGRPLSPGLSSTLLAIHDDYGLPVDVTLMLLQFVKSKGKDNTSYIEAVARDWAEEGISSHRQAEEKLRKLDDINKAWRKIEQELRLSPRSPSAREERYSDRWLLEWKFSPKMVREAYDRSVDAIGKLSLSYMNKILERWQREGITTPQQAAMEQTEKVASQKHGKPQQQTTYDIEEYERMSAQVPDILGKE
ncbi:DnaD domain protein [Faecalispora anaeroviscerum]|uniref:DnaD domain protein n=1 Tax=Faecalispora anaeroviscerum TaxID=2991836 RepID=UPI0024BA4762|nr:DnaD domain protein [Faecalispora anaeroviscerum]